MILILLLYVLGVAFSLRMFYREFDELRVSDCFMSIVSSFIPGLVIWLLTLNDPVLYKRKSK